MQQSNLKNKVYLVTGANGRIGYALSKQLILFGAKVIMTDILIDKIKFFNRNKNCLIKKVDVVKEENIKKIISIGVKKFKRMDGIIHCAYPVTKDWGKPIEKLKSKSLKENLFNQLGSSILISKNFWTMTMFLSPINYIQFIKQLKKQERNWIKKNL